MEDFSFSTLIFSSYCGVIPISAIFNHAVRFYELPSNPAEKAGNMGKEKSKEMLFWTKEEYLKFADSMMDKPIALSS